VNPRFHLLSRYLDSNNFCFSNCKTSITMRPTLLCRYYRLKDWMDFLFVHEF
jgi:hypothetical protein